MTPQQELFRLVRIAKKVKAFSWEDQKKWVIDLDECITKLTPRQFQEVYPIIKEYKGRFWGYKDYYTVTDWISENVGMDNYIPDGLNFLFEYLNDDTETAAVVAMGILVRLHQRQTGRNALLDFFEILGIKIHRFYENGNEID